MKKTDQKAERAICYKDLTLCRRVTHYYVVAVPTTHVIEHVVTR